MQPKKFNLAVSFENKLHAVKAKLQHFTLEERGLEVTESTLLKFTALLGNAITCVFKQGFLLAFLKKMLKLHPFP